MNIKSGGRGVEGSVLPPRREKDGKNFDNFRIGSADIIG